MMKKVAIFIIGLMISLVFEQDQHVFASASFGKHVHEEVKTHSDVSTFHHHFSEKSKSTESNSDQGHDCHLGHCPAVLFNPLTVSFDIPIETNKLSILIPVKSAELENLTRPPQA